MSTTKQRIIKNAQKLFFETGIANARLQQIADATEISVGNLAYHFRNKEAIVEAAYDEVLQGLSEMLSNNIKTDTLQQLDKHFERIFHLVDNYRFCFNNVWEISRYHPAIQHNWENFMKKKMIRTQRRIEFQAKRGSVKSEPYKGAYKLLAEQIVLVFFFWIPRQILNNKTASLSLFKKSLWNLLYPNLTAKGLKEYNQFIK
jgi:AcrR family transcriptional regulator